MAHTVKSILADITRFRETADWLYALQAGYDATDCYATGPDNVYASDLYVMEELFHAELGRIMLQDHRGVLDKIAKKGK